MRRDALVAEYCEVANNFRLLTDIRFRLLAFLPIAAGTTAGLLAAGKHRDPASEMRALVLSLFGLAVTIALATYNQRNDQLYDALVGRAASIERELGLPDGAFANRPAEWFAPLTVWKVNHRWPVALIYGASTGLWLYSAAAAAVQLRVPGDKSANSEDLLIAAGGAIAATVLAGVTIARLLDKRSEQRRASAKDAVERVRSVGMDLHKLAECSAFHRDCEVLGRVKQDAVKKRIQFYTDPKYEHRNRRYFPDSRVDDVDAAAAFVALLSDVPPEWIANCYTERRAT